MKKDAKRGGGETIRESASTAGEESKSMIERDGDRKERLG